MDGFLTNDIPNLDNQLAPNNTNRLLAKDIERRQNLPFSIGGGSRKSGVVQTMYWGNASAGSASETVDLTSLGLTQAPLAMVWFIGATSPKSPSPVTPGAGLLTYGDSESTADLSIPYGASASYNVTKTTLTINCVSQNVGWAYLSLAFFYYIIFYDEPDLDVDGL